MFQSKTALNGDTTATNYDGYGWPTVFKVVEIDSVLELAKTG